jgi:hypothetical protein
MSVQRKLDVALPMELFRAFSVLSMTKTAVVHARLLG